MVTQKFKFAIIGVSSFSGSWLCQHLLSEGHTVLGLGRNINQEDCFVPYNWSKNITNFSSKKVDINIDTDFIFESLDDFQPNYIINFAAQGMVAESWDKPVDWFQTNVLSQVKLLEKIKKLESLEKYINFSTPEVYGNTQGWVKENYNFQPSTPYATSRACFDMHLRSYFEFLNFPVIFTRASNVFGPGQQLYRILPKSILAAKGLEKLKLHGNGTSKRNFIDIRDVAKGIELICFKGETGKTYHISGKELIKIKHLVTLVSKYFKVETDDIIEVVDERLGKDESYALNSDFLRDTLKWSENYHLEETLKDTIDWIEKYQEDIEKMSFEYKHRS